MRGRIPAQVRGNISLLVILYNYIERHSLVSTEFVYIMTTIELKAAAESTNEILSSPVQKKKSTSEGENYANSGLDECE